MWPYANQSRIIYYFLKGAQNLLVIYLLIRPIRARGSFSEESGHVPTFLALTALLLPLLLIAVFFPCMLS